MDRISQLLKKPVVIIILVVLVLNGLYNRFFIEKRGPRVSTDIETGVTEEEDSSFTVLNVLSKYNLSMDEISDIKNVLVNVGIIDIWDIEIRDNGYGTQVVKGVIYKDSPMKMSKEVQVQFNVENGKIYLISIYCPSYGSDGQPTYLSGLDNRRADLFYDVEGGYLKRIDWEKKAVIDYLQ